MEIFKPKPRKIGKEYALNPADQRITEILRFFDAPESTALLRYKLYRKEWRRAEDEVKRLKRTWYKELTTEVVEFVKSIITSNSFGDAEIPLGFLTTALPSDENCELFESIISCIRLDAPHLYLVAQLSSKECPNVKVTYENIKQLIDCDHNISIDGKSTEEIPKPILIVIEDLDFFQPNVVKDLLQLLSCSKLSFVLLAGVTHGLNNFEHIIPSGGGTIFRYKLFSTIEARQRLDDFMGKVVLSLKTPFRLSGAIIKHLSDCFLAQDYSITRLKHAYQVCLLEHYRSAKSVVSSNEYLQTIGDLGMTLRTSKSFKKFQSQNKMKIIKSPKKNPIETGNDVNEVDMLLVELGKYRASVVNLFMVLHLFTELGTGLPNSPLGKNLQEMYWLAWDGTIFELGEDREVDSRSRFQQFESLVLQLSSEDMKVRLTRGIHALEGFHEENLNYDEWSDESNLLIVLNNLKKFLNELKVVSDERKENIKHEHEREVKTSPRKTKKWNGSTLLEFKANFKKQLESDKKNHGTAFENLRKKIAQLLKELASNHLKPMSTIPFSEVFSYDKLIGNLVPQLSPNVQLSIQKTLSSGFYPEDMSSCEINLWDTAVLYNLVLEGEMRRVDLNALYQSFKFKCNESQAHTTIPTLRGSRRASVKRKHSVTEDELLYRFRHSVAELQFLGYIKPSNTNPDEFYRLSWAFSIGN